MSNEKEIRNKLKKLISLEFPEANIKEEFSGGIMKTRPDLACFFQDNIAMIEIKSDKDTLIRLEKQVYDYSLYADNVIVVLDIVHKEKFNKLKENSPFLKHSYFKVLFYKNGKFYEGLYGDKLFKGFGNYQFVSSCNNIVFKDLYSLLWREEKKQLVSFIRGRSKVSIDKIIKQVYTIGELDRLCKEILYDRSFNKKYDGVGGKVKDIKFKDIKQIMFNDLFKKD